MPSIIEFSGDRDAVVARAQEVRRSFFEPGMSPQAAFQAIFKKYGGKVEYCNEDTPETLKVFQGGFVIYLPGSTSAARDNFTVAHELGHYFLHTDTSGDGEITHQRQGSSPSEWQANWFAAELLMPRELFFEVARENNNNPNAIAAHFNVSGAAARVRMSVLGIE